MFTGGWRKLYNEMLLICSVHRILLVSQPKKIRQAGEYSMHGRRKFHIKLQSGHLKEEIVSETWAQMASYQCPLAISCDHCNKPLNSTKHRSFLINWENLSFSRRTLNPGAWILLKNQSSFSYLSPKFRIWTNYYWDYSNIRTCGNFLGL